MLRPKLNCSIIGENKKQIQNYLYTSDRTGDTIIMMIIGFKH